jgi:hypothetical protein
MSSATRGYQCHAGSTENSVCDCDDDDDSISVPLHHLQDVEGFGNNRVLDQDAPAAPDASSSSLSSSASTTIVGLSTSVTMMTCFFQKAADVASATTATTAAASTFLFGAASTVKTSPCTNDRPTAGENLANRARRSTMSHVAFLSSHHQQVLHPRDHDAQSSESSHQQLQTQTRERSGSVSSYLTSFIYGDTHGADGDQELQQEQPQPQNPLVTQQSLHEKMSREYPSLAATLLSSELEATKKDCSVDHDDDDDDAEGDLLFVDRDNHKSTHGVASASAKEDDNNDASDDNISISISDNNSSSNSSSNDDGHEDGSMLMNKFVPRDEYRGTRPRIGRRHSSAWPTPPSAATTYYKHPAISSPHQSLQPNDVHDHDHVHVQAAAPYVVRPRRPSLACFVATSPACASQTEGPARHPGAAAAAAALTYNMQVAPRTSSLDNEHGHRHHRHHPIVSRNHHHDDIDHIDRERHTSIDHTQLREAFTALQKKYSALLLAKKDKEQSEQYETQQQQQQQHRQLKQQQQQQQQHVKDLEDMQFKHGKELEELQSNYDDFLSQHHDEVTHLELQMTEERQTSHVAQEALVNNCEEELSQLQQKLDEQEESKRFERKEHEKQLEELMQRQLEVIAVQKGQEQRIVMKGNYGQTREGEQLLMRETKIEQLQEELQTAERNKASTAAQKTEPQFGAGKKFEFQHHQILWKQQQEKEQNIDEDESESAAESAEEEHNNIQIQHEQQQLQQEQLEAQMQLCQQLRKQHAHEVLYLETQLLESQKALAAALIISNNPHEEEELALNSNNVEVERMISSLNEQNDAQAHTIQCLASQLKEKDSMMEHLEAQLEEESVVRDFKEMERSREERAMKHQLTNIKRQFKRHLSISSGESHTTSTSMSTNSNSIITAASSAASASESAATLELEATSILKTKVAQLQVQLQAQAQDMVGELLMFQAQLQKQHETYDDELASRTRYVDCLKTQLRQHGIRMPKASRDPDDTKSHRMMLSSAGATPSSWQLEGQQQL